MRVMGIDPGLRNMGWGVIAVDGPRLRHIGNGIVHSQGEDLGRRLSMLYRGLCAVIAEHAPDAAAVEQTFVNKDGASTLKLGQARGIAMLAPAMFGIAVAEYAPNQIKKTVVGAGHADKNQIRIMLGVLLPKADPQTPDAADALAIAITHAHHRQSAMLKLKVAAIR